MNRIGYRMYLIRFFTLSTSLDPGNRDLPNPSLTISSNHLIDYSLCTEMIVTHLNNNSRGMHCATPRFATVSAMTRQRHLDSAERATENFSLYFFF